jgi:hypothetical protein
LKLSADRIIEAVERPEWQVYRIGMKGTSTETKLSDLSWWLEHGPCPDEDRQIQVQNYLNALSRGGQIWPPNRDQPLADQIANAKIKG